MIMDKSNAKTIIKNAVEVTRPRWSQYDQSWSNIDVIFIYHGYEQQGFQIFKFKPVLEDLKIFSIDNLGNILFKYPHKRNYDREFAGSLTSEFYTDLQKGVSGSDGKLFVDAVRIFLDQKLGNPGRTFWKLLYQMLQACAFLKQNYSSSFAKYVISKYASFTNKKYISENDFLHITVPEWELFLTKTKPWSDLIGIGPNVFDFIFGDIVEARFVENSYKLDSANQHFLKVTGISQLIASSDKVATSSFLKQLSLPFSLREINKGIYTYCSETESHNYGYCRDLSKCLDCMVNGICEKKIQIASNIKVKKLGSQKSNKSNNPHTIANRKHTSSKGLPRLNDATTFKELSEIIRIRSDRYPTNYMDFLLLENEKKKLSEILTLWKEYSRKNKDFKDVLRIQAHIRYRENHEGWIFKTSGDPDNPVVKLIGLN